MGTSNLIDAPKIQYFENVFSCHAVFYEDLEVGGFSVIASNLPGVISEGETIDLATENIENAFRAAIETYNEYNLPIPWQVAPYIEPGFIVVKRLRVPLNG